MTFPPLQVRVFAIPQPILTHNFLTLPKFSDSIALYSLSDTMRTLRALWHKKASKSGLPNKPTGHTANIDRPLPHGHPYMQAQSLLFSQLPVELRLVIYHAVLVDKDRLLHIVHSIPDKGRELDRLGHWRCDDLQNPHMIWQHKCFGLWRDGDTWFYCFEPRTNSNSLALLRACRLR
jgi:hypothetical protein